MYAARGLAIRAVNGALGTVDQFLFDDQQWKIRYLVANIGGYPLGRLALIPVSALGALDTKARALEVTLNKQQLKDSPDITAHPPVSRQMAAAHAHTGVYPYGGLGGSGVLASAQATRPRSRVCWMTLQSSMNRKRRASHWQCHRKIRICAAPTQ